MRGNEWGTFSFSSWVQDLSLTPNGSIYINLLKILYWWVLLINFELICSLCVSCVRACVRTCFEIMYISILLDEQGALESEIKMSFLTEIKIFFAFKNFEKNFFIQTKRKKSINDWRKFFLQRKILPKIQKNPQTLLCSFLDFFC